MPAQTEKLPPVMARATDRDAPTEDRLKAALTIFETVGAENRRVGANLALTAAIDALGAAGIRFELLRPLNHLVLALGQLDEGRKPELFETSRKRGNQSLTWAALQQRGCMAAAVQIYFDSGMALEESAKRVAARIRKHPHIGEANARRRLRGDRPLWQILVEWREHAMGGLPDQDEDTDAYSSMLEMVRQADLLAEKAVTKVLKIARLFG
jgi:hypothetical protein